MLRKTNTLPAQYSYDHRLDSRDYRNPTYQARQAQRQEWNVGQWLQQHGVRLRDLDNHTQIDDVITLLRIRDELWSRMTASEQARWGAYWDIVYRKGYPLTKKFWKKFEQVVQSIDHRDHLIQQQRNCYQFN
jgi:hypothetical protein